MASSLRKPSGAAINFFSFIDIITGVTGVLILITLLLATTVNSIIPIGGLPEYEPDPALREKLGELLDVLSTLNLTNQHLQQSITAVRTAPSAVSLEETIANLRAQVAKTRQQAGQLEKEIEELERRERQRDQTLGLTDLSNQVEQERAALVRLRGELKAATEELAKWEAAVREAEAKLLQAQRDQNKLWVIPEPSRTTKEPVLAVLSGNTLTLEQFNKPERKQTLSMPVSERELRQALSRYQPLDHYIVFYVKPSGIVSFDTLKDAAKQAGYEVGYDALEEAVEINFANQPTP